MKLLWIILMALPLWAANLELETKVQYEPVPDENELFLQLPMAAELGSDGKLYVVDGLSKAVFVWQADGKFAGHFGKEGGGPGEFTFTGRGGPQAYVRTLGDKIYVWDGGKRNISIFDENLKYVESIPLKLSRGRTIDFAVTPNDQMVVYFRSFGQDQAPKNQLAIYDWEGNLVKELRSMEDRSFRRTGERGRLITGFSPNLVFQYDRPHRQFIIGHSSEPTFEVLDERGTRVRTVKFKSLQREITAADRDEFNEIGWIKSRPQIKTEFPEKMPYYTHILPMTDKGYLVALVSPFFRQVEGLLIDSEGKSLGRSNFRCGESGGIYGSEGKIIAIETDEGGDFRIRQIDFAAPTG